MQQHFFCLVGFVILSQMQLLAALRPHIIVVVADDLGWGDVSFHGSKQVPTPNIDALAADGLILNNYYVSPLCSPSRSAILSGRHPVHTGMQHDVMYNAEPWGFPLKFAIMPQFLKNLGYRTHAVGKWHLGFMKEDYTPTRRGFDSFFGYYGGHKDYLDHTVYGLYNTAGTPWTAWGIDMWDNLTLAEDALGKYSTNLFTDRAKDIIRNHDPAQPLFLYLCHLAVHVANIYPNLEAPQDYINKFNFITDPKRRTFAGMLSVLDDAIGELLESLSLRGMLNNTILVFTTDNGGAAGGVDDSAGSNWPLRGSKATLWEGGIRGTSVIWSPLLEQQGVADQMMHVSDWLPTLYTAAGGSVNDLGNIDGMSLWSSLSHNTPSPRNEILHNIDPVWKMAALRRGPYKILQGSYSGGRYDKWYPIPGETRRQNTDMDALRRNSVAAAALKRIGRQVRSYPEDVLVECGSPPPDYLTNCLPTKETCLFDIVSDPCEYNNLAQKFPEIVEELLGRLETLNASSVPPLKTAAVRKADPRFHGHVWKPYM